MKTKPIHNNQLRNVKVTRDVKDSLDRFARRTGRTRLHIVDQAVTEYINSYELRPGV